LQLVLLLKATSFARVLIALLSAREMVCASIRTSMLLTERLIETVANAPLNNGAIVFAAQQYDSRFGGWANPYRYDWPFAFFGY
jgi:hypothetical protein